MRGCPAALDLGTAKCNVSEASTAGVDRTYPRGGAGSAENGLGATGSEDIVEEAVGENDLVDSLEYLRSRTRGIEACSDLFRTAARGG